MDSDYRETTWNDINKAEQKNYQVHGRGLEHPSSRIIYFNCPWCGDEIKAYIWSLSGGGKKCYCGAIFGSGGMGFKVKP